MKILAIDTSCDRLLVAANINGKLFYKASAEDLKKHNSFLMPYIDDVLNSANVDINEIDGFSAVSGPGSFTGIRVGVSTVNAFSQALDKPAVGICSLEIALYGSPKNCMAVLDAGHGNFYTLQNGEKRVLTTDELEKNSTEKICFDKNYPPEILIALTKQKLEDGKAESPVVPDYMRKSAAEREKDGDR